MYNEVILPYCPIVREIDSVNIHLYNSVIWTLIILEEVLCIR